MTSDNTGMIGFLKLENENPILSKTESQYINMCQHPTHQVQVYVPQKSMVPQNIHRY